MTDRHRRRPPSAKRQGLPLRYPPRGRFGPFGGQYVPETLMPALEQLERGFLQAWADRTFRDEFDRLARQYGGRPSPLYPAARLTQHAGGAQILLKREDLVHGGAHKFNNVLGQGLLAKRLGKQRIIAETGAGQHGTATAMIGALLGLPVEVYMGAVDVERQSHNVYRMQLMGAKVIPVTTGTQTLKDAINEALRDWVASVETTHYLLGSVVGPHPYPVMVRTFASSIGIELREQVLALQGALPDLVIACVGAGSNALGTFSAFIDDSRVGLLGVEAGGTGRSAGRNSATLSLGSPGVLHGARTYLLQDHEGQIQPTHSIAAGLDYPGVGPEHAYLKEQGRAQYRSVDDAAALRAFHLLARLEGILPALESAHALAAALEEAARRPADDVIVVTLSGRGDKDLITVAARSGVSL